MDWDADAEATLKRVPFFVRRFARKRIEEMVRAEGGSVVTAEACRRARTRFADRVGGELVGGQAPSPQPRGQCCPEGRATDDFAP